MTREQVAAAAGARKPLHHTDGLPGSWYVLVGVTLHYVRDLVQDVTGEQPDIVEARKALHALGFPLFCRASHGMVDKGHPWHTGQAD
ncbi:hypothetical protein GUY60_26250 [Streptomyces sp. YC537]|uniref:Uncharacterized protein n=1 Tax=Streptomyces boluensis TaxID=1775135 RepID=A0A964UT59_9ACTN|nr:hypothetical protein [Streptomyces boluensis]